MNDPHIVALIYRLTHSRSVDYSEAGPLLLDEDAFELELKDNKLRIELKKHYSNEYDAKKSVDEYLRLWEFQERLDHGANDFKFEFEEAEIVDRSPNPEKGFSDIRGSIRMGELKASATLQIVANRYPSPPAGLRLGPDASVMSERYRKYLNKEESLLSCAYFCLTVLEGSLGVGNKDRRGKAAKHFNISKKVLRKIGHLSTKKGGEEARKYVGVNDELTSNERKFLKKAVVRIIYRVAEKNFDPNKSLKRISLSDLPSI